MMEVYGSENKGFFIRKRCSPDFGHTGTENDDSAPYRTHMELPLTKRKSFTKKQAANRKKENKLKTLIANL